MPAFGALLKLGSYRMSREKHFIHSTGCFHEQNTTQCTRALDNADKKYNTKAN